MRRRGAPKFESFSPGRKDRRINEARAFLAGAVHLRNVTESGLACQFNLKPATARLLIQEAESKLV